MSYKTRDVVKGIMDLIRTVRAESGYYHDAPDPLFRLAIPGSPGAPSRGAIVCVPLEGMDETIDTEGCLEFEFQQPIYVFTDRSQDRGEFELSASADLCDWYDDLLRLFTDEDGIGPLEIAIPGALVVLEPIGKSMLSEPIEAWPAHLRFLVKATIKTNRAALGPQGE